MPIKLSNSTAGRTDGGSNQRLLVAIARQHARQAAASVSALTDNSGGAASASRTLSVIAADLANVANSGSNLASAASASTQLNLVKDALLELATKANAVADAVGFGAADKVTYNGGGTAVDGIIAAIGTTTGAATGAQATNLNATISALNTATASIGHLINRLCMATGNNMLSGVTAVATSVVTVPAITVAAGTDASPGVTKAALDAKLALYSANIATMAARLNACRAAFVPEVVVVA